MGHYVRIGPDTGPHGGRTNAALASGQEQVRSAHHDLLVDDFDFGLGSRPATSWPECVEQLDLFRRAVQLPEPSVPATFLLAVVGGEHASALVITRCGGVLENIVENPEGGRRNRRYWID